MSRPILCANCGQTHSSQHVVFSPRFHPHIPGKHRPQLPDMPFAERPAFDTQQEAIAAWCRANSKEATP